VTSSDATASTPAAGPWERFGAAGDLLRRLASGGRTAPAYLFDGPDLSAPRAAARVFAAALLCEREDAPCGACSACVRVRSGAHPDLHLRGRDKATVISVEALAALLERAHQAPLEAERQVFIVEPADAMAPEAIARYLKSLEEPPPSTTFVLVTARPDRLPDTVRSRCQRVRFSAPPESEVAARLLASGVDAARVAFLARAADGSHARADRLARLGIDEAVAAMARAATGGVPAAATEAERILGELRRRAGEASTSAPDPAEGGGEAAPEGSPGEALRRALEDLFHALLVACRDRTAGLESGPLAALDPDLAATALERLGRLASYVRRNVTPAALLVEAVSAMYVPAARTRR
jgi:hypothetical protein